MYKLTESNKYNVGMNHYKWYLYTALYQHQNNYYFIIFDKENPDNIIVSAIVGSKTINDLENAIITAIEQHSNSLETIDDFYNELQKGFYGNMFKIQESAITAQ